MSREQTVTQRVSTSFGSMFIHIDYDIEGHVCGGWISDKNKDPEAQIVGLVEALSEGLNKALKNL